MRGASRSDVALGGATARQGHAAKLAAASFERLTTCANRRPDEAEVRSRKFLERNYPGLQKPVLVSGPERGMLETT